MLRRVTLHYDPPKPPRAKKPAWLPALYRGGKFSRVDGRSREGILLKRTNDALLGQLGRRPTAAEVLLIQRLSFLHLCLQLLDKRVVSGQLGWDEAAAYNSHIRSFSLGLANLGLLGNATTLPSLNDPTLTDPERNARYPERAQTRETAQADDDASDETR